MTFKLKTKPSIIDRSETKQFTIVDEEGNEYEIRIAQSFKRTDWFRWYEPGGWDEIIEVPILDYLENNFDDDEFDFDTEKRKAEEKIMDEAFDKFVSEHGPINSVKDFDSVVSELARVQDYGEKDYYERFYHAVYHAKKRIGF